MKKSLASPLSVVLFGFLTAATVTVSTPAHAQTSNVTWQGAECGPGYCWALVPTFSSDGTVTMPGGQKGTWTGDLVSSLSFTVAGRTYTSTKIKAADKGNENYEFVVEGTTVVEQQQRMFAISVILHKQQQLYDQIINNMR